jgi:hypothetical protein
MIIDLNILLFKIKFLILKSFSGFEPVEIKISIT